MLEGVDGEGGVECLWGPGLFVRAGCGAGVAVGGVGREGGAVVLLADGLDGRAACFGGRVGVGVDLEAGRPSLRGAAGFAEDADVVILQVGGYVQGEVALGGDAVLDVGAVERLGRGVA